MLLLLTKISPLLIGNRIDMLYLRQFILAFNYCKRVIESTKRPCPDQSKMNLSAPRNVVLAMFDKCKWGCQQT